MKLYFRPRITVLCLLLMSGMIRASMWQWDRHVAKQAYIDVMDERLNMQPVELTSLIPSAALNPEAWDSLIRRRVEVKGEYDFSHEMVLRNRRFEGAAGVYAITPLKISGTDLHILVNRGFLPLSKSDPDQRKEFQRERSVAFTGLLKESTPPRWFLSPKDPPSGPDKPWVDAWLRVDVAGMSQQLPYNVLPVQVEIISTSDIDQAKRDILKSNAGREELLVMGIKEANVAMPDVRPGLVYPVPAFDPVIPAGRHLGYVYEWAIMAVVTLLVMVVIQLKPPRQDQLRK